MSVTLVDPGALDAELPYTPAELEAVARLLLQDARIRVVPGAWWSYFPERSEVSYPPNLLDQWPARRSLGALCHEIAEVRYSGVGAVDVFHEFAAWAAPRGCGRPSAELLLNAINDLRINRLYLEHYPGSRRYFAALYQDATLAPKDDLRSGAAISGKLPHHAFVDGLTTRWAAGLLGVAAPGEAALDDRVRRGLERCWPAVLRAIGAPTLELLADSLRGDVFATYRTLLEASEAEVRRAQQRAEEVDEPPPPGESDEDLPDSDLDPADLHILARENPADDAPPVAWVLISDDDTTSPTDEPSGPPRAIPSAVGGDGRPPRSNGAHWTGGVVQKFRRLGRRSHHATIYEEFNYVETARRLSPQIDAILHGTPGRDGLIAILNRRRFGTQDPWRRPRRRRRGDSGDIDADHPENLVLAPATAFLRGQRQLRDDSQKDFAHAILLDVSGSIVQRGYRSRKFDQLLETLVVFCEIHQRLKLPFELIGFSDGFNVLRSFDECQYENLRIDPSSAYVLKDFSYIGREMYQAEHGETRESPALDRAIGDLGQQSGLKTVFVVTDGISSERASLTDRLLQIEQRNQYLPTRERLMVLAFGLGLAESEFNASYQPDIDGQPIQCSAGRLVPNVDALAAIVCDAVDFRIRNS
jgi:hypothetical protein